MQITVTVVSVRDPLPLAGVVNTDLARHMKETWWGGCGMVFLKMIMITPLQGAQTTLYCCLDESIAEQSGRYYSGCKEKRASANARKVEDQKRLWELSENMVGLT